MFSLKIYRREVMIVIFLLNSLLSYSFRLNNIVFNRRMDGEGGFKEFYLQNDQLAKQRYRVNVLESEKKDGSSFIEVFPKVITVDPQATKTLKVFAKAPEGTPEGEYYFKLQFQPINIPTLAKAKEGRVTGVSNIGIAPIIEMKGYVGEVDFSKVIKFENIQVIKNLNGKGIVVSGEISNESIAGIEFGVEAYGKNNFFYDGVSVGALNGKDKSKKIKFTFPRVKNEKDLKKIIFYRTSSNRVEILKEIVL